MGPFKYIGFTTGMMRPVNLIMKWKQLTISMKRNAVGCWQLAPNTQSTECCVCDRHVNKASAQQGRFDPSHLLLISGSGCCRVNSLGDELASWKVRKG